MTTTNPPAAPTGSRIRKSAEPLGLKPYGFGEVSPRPLLEPRNHAEGWTPRLGVSPNLRLSLDENGSPATVPPGDWLVCFVPGLQKQWWHPFVHGRHKHVFAMRAEPTGMWTLFEPWWRRLLTASINSEQARSYLVWAAAGDVLVVREAVPGTGSQFRGWMTCAVLVSFLLGRGYRTWTPHGLYRYLTGEPDVCTLDVSALLRLDVEDLGRACRAFTDEIAAPFRDRRTWTATPS